MCRSLYGLCCCCCCSSSLSTFTCKGERSQLPLPENTFFFTCSDSEDDDNEVIYNPKNLPLGWDGKPIPYWLYKLHGLNISYSCEICGNQVRESFQSTDSRGLSCLSIWNRIFWTIHRDGDASFGIFANKC